jgi:predicted RNA methylase
MDAIDLCSGDGWFALQIAKIAHYVVAAAIDRNQLEVPPYHYGAVFERAY